MAAKKSSESDQEQPQAAQPAAPQLGAGGAFPRGNRFFSWMRGLGIQRQPGWIGGVASGIGVRLGIDPIIVRGIIVVIAVLGGPALLLYAAAWLLLPDTDEIIHAEELGRGRFNPALVGIGVMVLLSLLPLTQGFWYAGALYWAELSWAASIGRVLWTALLLTAIVALVIWIARKASAPAPTVTPATTDDKPDTVPTVPTERAAALAATNHLPAATLSSESALAAPIPPPRLAPGAQPDDLQAWKDQQALWRQQHAEWKAQRTATERELRQQRAAESRERALLASARYAEKRRMHRLANPRITAAIACSVLGTALLAGGIAAIIASSLAPIGGTEVTVALASAALVLGLAIIIAGLLRRRSGILAFFAVIAILAMLASAAIPQDRILLPSGQGIGVGGDARYAQPFGGLYATVMDGESGGVTDVWQGTGNITLDVPIGRSVRIELVSRSGEIRVFDASRAEWALQDKVEGLRQIDDDWVWNTTIGVASTATPTIRIWQGGGELAVFDRTGMTEGESQP